MQALHLWLFFLLRYYSFECQCLACVQDWPQLEKLPKGVSQTPGLRSNSETQVSQKGNGVDEFLWWILPEMGSRSRETTIRGRGVALLHFTRLLFCNHRYLKHTGQAACGRSERGHFCLGRDWEECGLPPIALKTSYSGRENIARNAKLCIYKFRRPATTSESDKE